MCCSLVLVLHPWLRNITSEKFFRKPDWLVLESGPTLERHSGRFDGSKIVPESGMAVFASVV